MFPASLYTPLYFHAMLLVVSACALVYYWAGKGQAESLAQFNQWAAIAIGVGVLVFIGFRPVSGVFVDMPLYASSYERVQQGLEPKFDDWLFDGLVRLCSPVLPVGGFFFVCALLYIAPLAVASWRVHGRWGFPVFLAFLTAFSFWAYGVNGMRNGMATSVLILAFAFYDKPLLMLPLMAAAWGFHGSTILPAGAFLVVRHVKRTEIWLAFWIFCVATSLFAGNVGGMLLSHYNPLAYDERVGTYILGSEGSGFRADFLVYSIVPVIVTLLLAAPTRARARSFVARGTGGRGLNRMWYRGAVSVKGMGGLIALQAAGGAGGMASAGFGHRSRDPHRPAEQEIRNPKLEVRNKSKLTGMGQWTNWKPRRFFAAREQLRLLQCSAPGATSSTLNPQPSTLNPLARESQATAAQLSTLNSQPSTTPRPSPLAPRPRTAWGQLPWVQFLRTDPFYARLVNTYLLANALWVLLIRANFSNRFAYLSWFMMPWVLLYPFVLGKTIERPRTGFIAAILFAHYMFTYVMWMVFYRMSFG